MNLYSRLCLCGIPLIPISLAALFIVNRETGIVTDHSVLVFIALIPSLYTVMINLSTYANGKRKYGLLDAFSWRTDPYAVKSGKRKAMYPEIDSELISKEPTGIIIGKQGKRYVVNDLQKGGAHHTLVIGGSGCGKTSAVIIPTVLSVKETAKIVVDIKGEISEKGEDLSDPSVLIVNPTDRKSCGYDPLYRLGKDSDKQEIIDTLNNIMYSILPINAAEKSPFWSNGARDMFMGFSIFYVRNGIRDFIGITDEILGKPIKDSVEQVMNEADPDSPEYRYIVKFHDMADETLSGIYAQLSNYLTLFSNDSRIRWMMQVNPLKVNPRYLNDKKSIYIVIKEEMLSQYAPILHLIINQTIAEMELRPEGSSPVLLIIDELARITSTGKIHKITDGLATLRSRNVSMLLVTQSMEALENAYTKSEVSAIAANIPYKVVLQASSMATQKDIIGWSGKYKEYKETYGKNGKGSTKSTSYEEKDIVSGADLMALPTTGEAILISPYGYNRVKKCPYYTDGHMKKQAEKIREENRKLKALEVNHDQIH